MEYEMENPYTQDEENLIEIYTSMNNEFRRKKTIIDKLHENEKCEHEYIQQIAEYIECNEPSNYPKHSARICEIHKEISAYYERFIKQIEDDNDRIIKMYKLMKPLLVTLKDRIPEVIKKQTNDDKLHPTHSKFQISINYGEYNYEMTPPWFYGRFHFMSKPDIQKLFDIPWSKLYDISCELIAWPDRLPKDHLVEYIKYKLEYSDEVALKAFLRLQYIKITHDSPLSELYRIYKFLEKPFMIDDFYKYSMIIRDSVDPSSLQKKPPYLNAFKNVYEACHMLSERIHRILKKIIADESYLHENYELKSMCMSIKRHILGLY